MLFLSLSLFAISLIYLALYRRVKRYIGILAVQGCILAIIAILVLHKLDIFHLVFILLETIIIKAIAIPVFLESLRKRNNLDRLSHSNVPRFLSVIIISVAIALGFFLTHVTQLGNIHKEILAVSISSVITGLYFIITHKNIFTHLVGYLVIENGILLLSLSIGAEMPILVNMAILLDVFVGVLMLGIFINRIGDKFKEIHIDELSKLVD